MIKILCNLHHITFMNESECEKWKPSEYAKSLSGSGSSTPRRCWNCLYGDYEMRT